MDAWLRHLLPQATGHPGTRNLLLSPQLLQALLRGREMRRVGRWPRLLPTVAMLAEASPALLELSPGREGQGLPAHPRSGPEMVFWECLCTAEVCKGWGCEALEMFLLCQKLTE